MKGHAPDVNLRVNDPVMFIGAATKITGLSESALRKYEATGLIIFHRTAANRRMLSLEDIERIRMIRNLIKRRGLNLEGILRLWALLPCWELKQCAADERRDCPAIVDSQRPCWVLLKNQGCTIEERCRECEVYRFSAYCTEDLKSLVRNLYSSESSKAVEGESD